jgi:UDP-N-acetylmuramate dehydrogenase
MAWSDAFQAFGRAEVPLAGLTALKRGGNAEFLAEPRSISDVQQLIQARQPVHVLGHGTKLAIQGNVPGLTIRLTQPEFQTIQVNEKIVRAGAGASLFQVISQAALAGLSGLESLIGFNGTVGGCVRNHIGDRFGSISNWIKSVETLDTQGNPQTRERSDLYADDHTWDLDDPVILAVEFELETDSQAAIEKRLRKTWIQRSGIMPTKPRLAVQLFHDPRGQSAANLIEQAGLAQASNGKVEIAERNANYAILNADFEVKDLLGLVQLVQERVREQCRVQLVRSLNVW